MKNSSRLTFVALALALLLIPNFGMAQTSRTTGALIGIVTDGQGNPLPGVTVTVTSPQLQGARTAVTDTKGEYILPTLPPGTYRAQYELNGIKTAVRENIVVNLNQQTKVNVPMQLALSETVIVNASTIVVDPTQTATQTNFKEDHLKYAVVGSTNRSYQSVLAQAPGVGGPNATTGPGGGGNPQVSGANLAQNNFLVDGLNTTDPVTHTFGPNLAFDAIQEISIQTLGKDAEYGASGGTINVITKSGGNNFSGSADYRYNDPHFLSAGQRLVPGAPSYYGGPAGASKLAFNKAAQTNKSKQPQATFGGPILRDKLWFFGSAQKPETSRQAPNLNGFQPGPRTFTGWNTIGKLTLTPWANQTFTGRYLDSHANISNISFSSLVPTEADARQTQHTKTWGLSYDAIVNAHWLANVSLGHTPSSLAAMPMTGNLSTPGNQDVGTGINSINYTNNQGRSSKRDELIGTSTYYIERFGTHGLKGGVDYNKTSFSSINNAVGDPSLIPGFDASFCSPQYGFPTGITCSGYTLTNNGQPFQIYLQPLNPQAGVDSKSQAYFVQDEWSPVSRATIRAGLRYEYITWGVSGKSIPNFKLLQPRLGFAYDIFNNATSVVHSYAGKIMDDNQLTLPNFGVAQPLGWAFFNYNATTGKYVYNPGASLPVFLTGGSYDSNLKPSYSNQYSLGFTQRIWRNTSLDVTGEMRKQHNLFEDYCGNETAGFFDTCILTNQPGSDVGVHNALRSDYRGIITKIESRPYNWLDLLASWTRAKSRGSTESTQNQNTSFDFYPANFTNTYGYLTDDARDRVKLDGYVRLPLDFTVGANYYWDSGTPWNVTQTASLTSVTGVDLPEGTYFIEPRGSRRLPHFSQLDMQVQKDFRVANTKLGLIATVYNVMNHETITALNGNAGARAKVDPTTGTVFIDPNQQTGANRLSRTFGQPTAFQIPRRYEAGIRVEF